MVHSYRSIFIDLRERLLMFKPKTRDAVLDRVDALPVLPTIPQAAKALDLSSFQMRGIVDSGLVEAVPVPAGKVERVTRQSLRRLAEQAA
jgi:hypothetical protein